MSTDPLTEPELTGADQRALRMARRRPQLGTRLHRFALRVSRGRLDPDVALLTTTGRRSGRPRTVPVMHLRDGDRFLVVAMNNGFDPHPGWFHNLVANPDATIQMRGGSHGVRARVVPEAERAAMWPRLVEHQPLWAAFQAHTDRVAPVVELTPRP